MAHYLRWGNEGYANNLFDLGQNRHYTIPKPKFLYFVQFNITESGKKLLQNELQQRRLSFMVKSVDRPTIQYKQEEVNQYNRKRLVTTGMTFGSINMTFHDTIDETANKMVQDYNRYYYNDFNQDYNAFRYDVVSGVNNSGTWGYNPRNGTEDVYFFTSIDIYEFYNGYYTKTCLMNPKFESVTYSSEDMASSEGNEITVSLKYEGAVFEEMSEEMTPEISELVGLPYQSTLNNFRPNEVIYETNGDGIKFSGGNTSPTFNVGDPGSFITRSPGELVGGIINNAVNEVINTGLNNFLSNSGTQLTTTVGSNLVSVGTRSLTSLASRIF